VKDYAFVPQSGKNEEARHEDYKDGAAFGVYPGRCGSPSLFFFAVDSDSTSASRSSMRALTPMLHRLLNVAASWDFLGACLAVHLWNSFHRLTLSAETCAAKVNRK
jgi:hypothetical protein